MSDGTHIPVLLREVIEALAVQAGGCYIDATIGSGGHAEALLESSSPGGQLLGIDADPESLEVAKVRLQRFGNSVLLVNDNFANLESICMKYDFSPVHGILFDLGLSSRQLESDRGFSFQRDAPLDMRFDPHQKITAADIVNNYPETQLADIIWTYGEESQSRQIARRIIQLRPIQTTSELVRVIEGAVGYRRGRIHPATKTFQALRIVVNQEMDNLRSALSQTINLLGFRGRLVVISYHSLEDRIVKQFMQRESRDCVCPPGTPTCICGHAASIRMVHKKVIIPSRDEIGVNPRSRSAKLRVAERIVAQDERYTTIERLCFSMDGKENGWRRPVMLARLRRAFSAI